MTVIELFNQFINLISTDFLRILTIIPVLLYASYTDISSRKVHDNVWVITAIIALLLLSYDIYVNNTLNTILATIISVTLVGGLSYIIYKLRIFYGADYKAFVIIALLFPWQPTVEFLPMYDILITTDVSDILNYQTTNELIHNLTLYASVSLFGFTAFVNTVIFSVVYFVWNAVYNIKTEEFSISKPLRSLTAQKVLVSELENRHGNVIEKPEGGNKISKGYKFMKNGLSGFSTEFFRDYMNWYRSEKTVSKNISIDNISELDLTEFLNKSDKWESTEVDSDKQKLENIIEQERVWITPGTPFIVPITLGVFSAILFGNIVYVFLMLVL